MTQSQYFYTRKIQDAVEITKCSTSFNCDSGYQILPTRQTVLLPSLINSFHDSVKRIVDTLGNAHYSLKNFLGPVAYSVASGVVNALAH